MSEKALRWIINIAGIVCLYAFLAIRILPLFNMVLLEKYIPEYWENTKYGELYYFNFIKQFREQDLPEYSEKYRFTDKHPSMEEADILTFGDSFFDFSRMTTFPEKLGDSLNKKVFYARFDQPLAYLEANNYSDQKKKYIIYETAERFLHDRFSQTHGQSNFLIDKRSGMRKLYGDIRDLIFLEETELLFAQLLNRSYFTTHIYSFITTFKFNFFKHVPTTTPLYSLEDERPWLFGGIQVDETPRSFYYQHSEEEIDTYCDNITLLAKDLKEQYNLEFIFMVIPSKYTIYHTLLNDDEYNNFIPRLCKELKIRNIPVINFYDELIAQRDSVLLYYGTDTHWTEEGLNIALNETFKVFYELDQLNYLAGSDIIEAETSSH